MAKQPQRWTDAEVVRALQDDASQADINAFEALQQRMSRQELRGLGAVLRQAMARAGAAALGIGKVGRDGR